MKKAGRNLVATYARHGSTLLALLVVTAIGATMSSCNTVPPTATNREVHANRPTGLRATTQELEARFDAQVFEGACDIGASVGAFQAALGTLNPNVPGSFGSGRREINWDAVPPAVTNINNFAADFFNAAAAPRARGAVFTTDGSGFRVSDNDFFDVNPSYGDQFGFFSPIRTFSAVGSNRSGVLFFVPGSSTPATTTGFGVVFSDIDHRGSGMLRLFDAQGRSLGTYLAPPCPGGLSFVGVMFADPIVARVEIISGHGALGSDSFDLSSRTRGPARDLAIMDDFIYGEPIAQETGTTRAAASR